MNGYEIAWSGTLEREAIRQQQRHPEHTPQNVGTARARIWQALQTRPRHWWTTPEVVQVTGGDLRRTVVADLLRDFYWRRQVERRAGTKATGGLVWRYRVKG